MSIIDQCELPKISTDEPACLPASHQGSLCCLGLDLVIVKSSEILNHRETWVSIKVCKVIGYSWKLHGNIDEERAKPQKGQCTTAAQSNRPTFSALHFHALSSFRQILLLAQDPMILQIPYVHCTILALLPLKGSELFKELWN